MVSDKHTSHAFINLAENNLQALDEEYIGCGISVDLERHSGS